MVLPASGLVASYRTLRCHIPEISSRYVECLEQQNRTELRSSDAKREKGCQEKFQWHEKRGEHRATNGWNNAQNGQNIRGNKIIGRNKRVTKLTEGRMNNKELQGEQQ
jgi:hypothetical protein